MNSKMTEQIDMRKLIEETHRLLEDFMRSLLRDCTVLEPKELEKIQTAFDNACDYLYAAASTMDHCIFKAERLCKIECTNCPFSDGCTAYSAAKQILLAIANYFGDIIKVLSTLIKNKQGEEKRAKR